MKRILLLLAVICILGVNDGFSQKVFDGFSYKIVGNDYLSPVQHKVAKLNELTPGLEIDFIKNISDDWSFVLPVKFAKANFPDKSSDAAFYIDGLINFSPVHNSWLKPYVILGVGTTIQNSFAETSMQVPFGGGLHIKMTDGVFFTLQLEGRKAFSDNRTNNQYGIGLTFMPDTKDTDGDGIVDSKDMCPTVPGIAAFKGCPDTDGDGITDAEDNCPNVAGTAAFGGCPDTDGDGIMDKEDSCPNVAGIAAFGGCPDTDGDGIEDAKDACPKVAGLAAMNGCPDTDGDGIVDGSDGCPNVKGPASNNGCPFKDTDGDGIADKDDACPSAKGTKANGGCPDKDGDGVIDREDSCIDVAGPKSNKGCPEMKKEDVAKLNFATKAVEFRTGKTVIREKSKHIIDEVAALMLKYPAYVLSISGYTDNVGNADRNQTLSEGRAVSCMNYLVSKGIDPVRMTAAGYGEANPIDTNKTSKGRQHNRRTEFNMFIK